MDNPKGNLKDQSQYHRNDTAFHAEKRRAQQSSRNKQIRYQVESAQNFEEEKQKRKSDSDEHNRKGNVGLTLYRCIGQCAKDRRQL